MPELKNPKAEEIMNRFEWIGVLKMIAQSEDEKLFIRVYMNIFCASKEDALKQYNAIQN